MRFSGRGSNATFPDTTRVFVGPSPYRRIRCRETWAKRRLVHRFDHLVLALRRKRIRRASSETTKAPCEMLEVNGDIEKMVELLGGGARRYACATSRRYGRHPRRPASGATGRNCGSRSGS